MSSEFRFGGPGKVSGSVDALQAIKAPTVSFQANMHCVCVCGGGGVFDPPVLLLGL
jgi:hypothetical protein